MTDAFPSPESVPGRPPLDPRRPDTPLHRLHARIDAVLAEHAESAVAGVAVRMLEGRVSVEDVGSGVPAALLGEDETFTTAATGALTLTAVWHGSALPSLRAAVGSPEAEVRAAALLVLSTRAPRLHSDAHVDAALVESARLACGDADPRVREAAAGALGELARQADLEAAVPVLSALVMDVDAGLAAAAELALTRLADRFDLPALRPGSDV